MRLKTDWPSLDPCGSCLSRYCRLGLVYIVYHHKY